MSPNTFCAFAFSAFFSSWATAADTIDAASKIANPATTFDFAFWRVDIELPPVGILCILCYLPLSMREVPHYSAVGDISLPLTEPDLQISHIRLFSYPHFAGDKV